MNEDGENLCITREYTTKAHFISDLHGNGYKVHFVALTDKYDEESAKYYERLETKRRRAAIRRECKREWKRRDAEFEKAVAEAVAEEEAAEEPAEVQAEEPAEEKPAENPNDSAFIAEMFAALDYFKRVLWSYIDGTRYERDISGDFWGAHECSVILSFVNVLLKSQGKEPYYKLKNDFDDLTECFEEIMQKFEYGDERTIEEIISEYNFS